MAINLIDFPACWQIGISHIQSLVFNFSLKLFKITNHKLWWAQSILFTCIFFSPFPVGSMKFIVFVILCWLLLIQDLQGQDPEHIICSIFVMNINAILIPFVNVIII